MLLTCELRKCSKNKWNYEERQTLSQWRNNSVAGRAKCQVLPDKEGRERRRILTFIITKLRQKNF